MAEEKIIKSVELNEEELEQISGGGLDNVCNDMYSPWRNK